MMKRVLSTIVLIIFAISSAAEIRLPSIIGNDMVLQRNGAARLWGWAAPSEKIEVMTSWNGQKYVTRAQEDGAWEVLVETGEAGGPYLIDICCGKEMLSLSDVLIGEVWICSGQSNMEMPVHGFYGQPVEGSADAVFEANEYPDIRMFTIPPTPSFSPLKNCQGEWKVSSPSNVRDFSAVGYFFGKYLNQVLGIPIGLITPNVGGIAIESWMTSESIRNTPGINHARSLERRGNFDAACVSTLYNGMISPIAGFSSRGFVWYQGESNMHNSEDYDKLMASMVRLWRDAWKNEKMPFLFTQLTPFPYDDPDGVALPLTVEAQSRALKLIPDSWMAVTTDLGSIETVHPPKKKEVSRRLASLALGHVYHIDGLLPDAPVVDTVKFIGSEAIVVFSGVPDYAPAAVGSLDHSVSPIRGFEMAGDDGTFYPAEAKVMENTNQVKVVSVHVQSPVELRYAFHNWTDANLRTTEGQPVSPFRYCR